MTLLLGSRPLTGRSDAARRDLEGTGEQRLHLLALLGW